MTPLQAVGYATAAVALSTAVAAVSAVLWAAFKAIHRVVEVAERAPQGGGGVELLALTRKVAELEVKLDGLETAWKKYRDQINAAADRLRQRERAARRAEAQLDDDDDAPAVPASDGAGGAANGVLPMSANVGAPEPDYIALGWARKLAG